MAVRSIRVRLIDIRDEIAGYPRPDQRRDRKEKQPDVPWRKIHGLGNLLRHEYRRIDPDILWSVIVDYVGPLDEAAAAMLKDTAE